MISISIEGLKEKYRINEPIEFSVIIKGFLSGNGCPRVKITNEKDARGKIYDIAFMSPSPPQVRLSTLSRLCMFHKKMIHEHLFMRKRQEFTY